MALQVALQTRFKDNCKAPENCLLHRALHICFIIIIINSILQKGSLEYNHVGQLSHMSFINHKIIYSNTRQLTKPAVVMTTMVQWLGRFQDSLNFAGAVHYRRCKERQRMKQPNTSLTQTGILLIILGVIYYTLRYCQLMPQYDHK